MMKRFRILFLVAVFMMCWVDSALSEEHQNITFQKSQSYELADIFNIFAPPKNMGSEMD